MTLTTDNIASKQMAEVKAPLNTLPPDVAEQLKQIAWGASWYTANTRAGYNGDAAGDILNFQQGSQNLDAKAVGLGLTQNTLNDIKSFAMDAAWHCANERKGYSSDAAGDLERTQAEYTRMVSSGELAKVVVDNLTNLCWAAAWYCANTRAGYSDDAKADQSRFDYYFNQLCGSVTFVDIKFLVDQQQMLALRPVAVVNQTLKNEHPTLEQEMSIKVSTTKGYTKEWSHSVGFKVTSTTTISASFEVVDASESLSFEASYGYTWGGSETNATTEEYDFPVNVGPKEQVSVKGIVQEAEMTVPYELVYKIGDVERRSQGTWRGVACSSATMEVSPPIPLK